VSYRELSGVVWQETVSYRELWKVESQTAAQGFKCT